MNTVAQSLAAGLVLVARGSDSPQADVRRLLSFVMQREPAWLLSHGEYRLTSAQSRAFAECCRKRAAGMPVAYLTGFAGFFGREFAVDERVLVPRPQTEHLVEDAIAHLRGRLDPRAPMKQLLTVFEAGVGSGAIACSIAAEVPGAIVEGSDVSEAALAVAQLNARRLNVQNRCTFYRADIVRERDAKSYDVVVANLPYVPTADIPAKPDPVGYEPRVALDGGPDGLNAYRKLLAAAPRMLRPGSLLLLEAAPPTIPGLERLARAALPSGELEVRRDYGGHDRYLAIRTPPRSAA